MLYRPLRPLMWRFAIQSAKHDKRAWSNPSLFFLLLPPIPWIVYNLIFVYSWLMGIIYFLCSPWSCSTSLHLSKKSACISQNHFRELLESIHKHTFRYREKKRRGFRPVWLSHVVHWRGFFSTTFVTRSCIKATLWREYFKFNIKIDVKVICCHGSVVIRPISSN